MSRSWCPRCVAAAMMVAAGCRSGAGAAASPQCAAAVAAAYASLPDSATAGLTPAQLEFMPMVPLPMPASLHGKTVLVRVVVDEQGRVDARRLTFEGLDGSPYEAQLRDAFRRLHYTPAVLGGCHVPSLETLELHL